jgi:probable addiction module antidote protein
MKPDRDHDEASAEMFRNDPDLAADFLNGVLADGDEAELMIALRTLSKAFGGVQDIAKRADLNPNTLYRTLGPTGNPALRTLTAVLKTMGMRLAVTRDTDSNHTAHA